MLIYLSWALSQLIFLKVKSMSLDFVTNLTACLYIWTEFFPFCCHAYLWILLSLKEKQISTLMKL